MRSAAPRSSGARSGLHHRLGQPCGRLRHDIGRILLQGPDRAGDGGNQARRRGFRAGLRHPWTQHLQPAGEPRAVRPSVSAAVSALLPGDSVGLLRNIRKASLVAKISNFAKNLVEGEAVMSPAEARLKEVPSDMTDAEWSQRVNLAACYRIMAGTTWSIRMSPRGCRDRTITS